MILLPVGIFHYVFLKTEFFGIYSCNVNLPGGGGWGEGVRDRDSAIRHVILTLSMALLNYLVPISRRHSKTGKISVASIFHYFTVKCLYCKRWNEWFWLYVKYVS